MKIAVQYCAWWISAIYAARVAARIRRELKADVEMVHGRYGEFKVIVDGQTVIDGGTKVILGIMPSADEIIEAVRQHLSA